MLSPLLLKAYHHALESKTMAPSVNPIITEIIHPDQTGFITGSYYGDNLWRLLNIISPPSLQNLYEANYSKIIRCIDGDLERWSTLPQDIGAAEKGFWSPQSRFLQISTIENFSNNTQRVGKAFKTYPFRKVLNKNTDGQRR